MGNQGELYLTKDDFTVFGETRTVAVDESSNYNFVNRFGNRGFWWTFSIGDDLTTYRGITIGSTKDEVFEKYGEMQLLGFNAQNDYLVYKTLLLHKDKLADIASQCADKSEIERQKLMHEATGDFKNIKGDEQWAEYFYVDEELGFIYFLRFYINSDDKVVLIGFYNLDIENAEAKFLDDFYRRKNKSYGKAYHNLYKIQYRILPGLVFTNAEKTIKFLNDNRNFVYDLIEAVYKDLLKTECPYSPQDISISNKVLLVDNETYNMTTIRFDIEMKGVLSKAVFIVCDNNFKNPRYFTAENDEFGDDENIIHLCEVYKDGRQNYGKMIYDENAIEKRIIDIFTDKVVTSGMVTKYPKPKAKKKVINVNDKPWIGIRADAIDDWNTYEPDSKLKNVKGMLIFGLEVGSPFKECNLDFDTENIITKFDDEDVTSVEEMRKSINKHKPGDKVKITIDVYDNENDELLSREYIIKIGSKNDDTYEFDLDWDTINSKTNKNVKARNNKNRNRKKNKLDK